MPSATSAPEVCSQEPHNVAGTRIEEGDGDASPNYCCYAIVHAFFALLCVGALIGAVVLAVAMKRGEGNDSMYDDVGYRTLPWYIAAFAVNGAFMCTLGTVLLRGNRKEHGTELEAPVATPKPQAGILHKAYLCAFHINLIVIPATTLAISLANLKSDFMFFSWCVVYFPIGWSLAIMTAPLAMSVHRLVLNCCIKCPPCQMCRVELQV